ncbi:DNA-3-methyladenine glycosylase [Streptomyces sp. V4I2]|uniref:DNA-3-methyladenine glycosylase family protein n=1 Tax=Streptomyces sp. V4I2 TaxID=3042280 RepID=UPI0027D8D27F|nr:DNA-3-methyladenine glycosylase 2 family protein [Streptomyces sp. V4I2]
MTGEQGTAAGVLTMALREGGTTVGAALTAVPAEHAVDCTLSADVPIGEATVDAVMDRLDFYLGLQDDLTGFYQLARQDPPFGRVLERLRGYHQVKFPSPWELLCWAILCQRVPMPVARQMKRALVEAVGNRIAVRGETRWAFPDADQLRTFDEADLRSLIGNERKAGYLYGAVRQWDELDEKVLRTGPYDGVREQLLRIPGIGPWSASFLLVRGLGRTERVSLDKEMLRAARRVYGRTMDEQEFQRLADHYGTWQGYWGHYLRVGG